MIRLEHPAPKPQTVTPDELTLDDLERLAFIYGGTVARDIETGTYRLIGALMDGRRVNLGPVRGGGL
jgi:hypothetical protein